MPRHPWLTAHSTMLMEHLPMTALELRRIEKGGRSLAAEHLNPSSEIVRALSEMNFSFPISEGVNHRMPPSQKDFTEVSGVPPPMTSAISRKDFFSQIPLKPGNLKAGTLVPIFDLFLSITVKNPQSLVSQEVPGPSDIRQSVCQALPFLPPDS